jgi:predicted MFS family arabinose efflux permease
VIYQREWAVPAWLLGLAFSAYAFTLLLAIVTVGSLSDYVGRRKVVAGALVVEIVAMLLLAVAPSIAVVLVARLLQGLATGVAITTLSAALSDLSPRRNRQLGATFASVAPLIGLTVGALGSGIAIQLSASAATGVYSTLVALLLIGLVLVAATPTTITPVAGALRSLIPEVHVPTHSRPAFVASGFLNVAVWLSSGLSLGLVGQINRDVFDLRAGLVNGGTIALLMGTASVTVLVSRRTQVRTSGVVATIVLGVASILIAAGVLGVALPLYLVGTALAGVGVGLGFGGYIRLLAPTAAPAERAGLFAAMYTVSYLTFGLPIVVAGLVLPALGATSVVVAYCAITVVAAALGLQSIARFRGPVPTAPGRG